MTLKVGSDEKLSFWTQAGGIGKNGTVQVSIESLCNSPTEWVNRNDAKEIIKYLTSAFNLESEGS